MRGSYHFDALLTPFCNPLSNRKYDFAWQFLGLFKERGAGLEYFSRSLNIRWGDL
jgi:hypothetical protein